MNQKLKSLDIEKMLFWDIETVRGQEKLEIGSEEYNLYRQKTRDRDTDDFLKDHLLLEEYERKGALNPTLNKIVCISMAVVSKGRIIVKSFSGTQKEIVEKFLGVLQNGYMPCGWNIVGFDFPVLRQKAFKEGLLHLLPERFNDAGKKEWAFTEVKYETNVVDLMLFMKGTYFYSQSLAEACYLAGIPSPKNDNIEGSKVSQVYYSEGVDRIVEYCERDVVSCVQLFQAMRGEALFTEVVKKKDSAPVEPAPVDAPSVPIKKKGSKKTVAEEPQEDSFDKKLTVLQKIYEQNEISEPTFQELQKLLKERGITEQDADKVFTILRGVYIRTGMNEQDNKSVVAQKEEDIKNLLDTLLK